MKKAPVKVLIIDDSALVRKILSEGLSRDPGLEVVGTAPDVYIGRDMIVKLSPDVLTLDIEMPKMDGVEFLRRLMPQYPLPVIIVSSLSQRGKQITIDALEAGALDFVPKPRTNLSSGLVALLTELSTKIKLASTANVSSWKQKKYLANKSGIKQTTLYESTDKVVAIGASTGGTEAIKAVVTDLPSNTPGIVIVQHMPPVFTKMFANRLNEICNMSAKEAEDGDRIITGRILVAPGGKHLRVKRSGGTYIVKCKEGEKVSGHCPSVDVMMSSVAKEAGANAYGIILTGMGKDGAEGMLAMKKAGAWNIAQDKATSVVYGMPKVAADLGGVDKIVPLDKITDTLIKKINGDI